MLVVPPSAARPRLRPAEEMAFTIKAWNYRRTGRQVRKVRWNRSQGEAFPKIL